MSGMSSPSQSIRNVYIEATKVSICDPGDTANSRQEMTHIELVEKFTNGRRVASEVLGCLRRRHDLEVVFLGNVESVDTTRHRSSTLVVVTDCYRERERELTHNNHALFV